MGLVSSVVLASWIASRLRRQEWKSDDNIVSTKNADVAVVAVL